MSELPPDHDPDDEEELRPPSLRQPAPTGAPPPPAYPGPDDEDDGEDYVIQPPGKPPFYKQPRVFVPLLILLVLLLWFVVPSLNGKKKASTTAQTTTAQTTQAQRTTPATTPAQTTGSAAAARAAFLSRADAVCRAEQRAFIPLDRRYRGVKSLKGQAAYLSAGARLFARTQARLAAVRPTAPVAAAYRRWLVSGRAELALMRLEARALYAGQVKAANRLDARVALRSRQARAQARSIGFQVCGR